MPDGFKTIKVDRSRLVDLMEACYGKHYRFGAKVALDAAPSSFDECDCSGFVRWLLHGSTSDQLEVPDGSWNQHQWCRTNGFKATDYSAVAGLKDSRLRIAFIEPRRGRAGHVWLIINGGTIESYGGHGPGRRG